MSPVEVKVPDIGDFKSVDVIEILVKSGDRVEKEQSLITLESDKATMEIPSPAAGVVGDIKVKVGDQIAEGAVILMLNAALPQSAAQPVAVSAPSGSPQSRVSVVPAASAPPASPPPAPRASAAGAVVADLACDVVVLGSGPGGYSAAFRAADLGQNTVLVERYPTLGGVCLNVGCIPSKALLHVAAVVDEAQTMAEHGIVFGKPQIDLAKLRGWKSKVVGKLTTGLAAMAKMRKVTVVQGVGAFIDPHHMAIETPSGKRVLRFDKAIIAAGSESVALPFLPADPRIMDSTGALELRSIPKKMLVIGGGIIGLEMGTVYSTLGTRLDLVEMMDGLMAGPDRDLVRVWQKINAPRFDRIMLKTKTVKAEATSAGIAVSFEGEQAPAGPQLYDALLVSVGRSPNGKRIGAEYAGVSVDAPGFIAVDSQMRTNVPHIYAIGDIVGQPMLAHKATHEGHLAAEAAAGQKSHFDAKVIPSVAYTDPEVAWVGLTEDQAARDGRKVGKGLFPWAALGRAIANGRDEGFTKLLFDEDTHRIVGGGIVGTHAGDLIGEIALAIEMGADATDIGKTIHPHPTLAESVGLAAELYEGVCTDLPPKRR
ncbi:MAG: dihydrolipoyl dehydrogenase [Betaproteobacteria bacterium]|nr:dihydrolipoyl dehydrogenase [Betaproteobacteria bacterium]